MGTVTGGKTAEYMKDRLLEDVRELKSRYKANEDRAIIGKVKYLAEEAAERGEETIKRSEKALGVSIDGLRAVKDSSIPKYTPDTEIHELESKIRNGSDVYIGYSIGRECYNADMDYFEGWQEAFGDSLKLEGDSYQGDNFHIWLQNKANGRHTKIYLRANKGSYVAEALEKLVELKQVPIGV